jgi:glycosyltransferase involved in cell wall biosynthesis
VDKYSICIVTVVFNDLKGLRRTYNSVIGQTLKPLQWIVIDGGSNDGCATFLKSLDLSYLVAISEPDNGIYDAMNKGTILALGSHVLYLNAGDELVDKSVLFNAIRLISYSSLNLDESFFGRARIRNNKEIIRTVPSFKYSISYPLKFEPVHQSIFFSRRFVTKIDGYDLQFQYMADAVLKAKANELGLLRYIDLDVCDFYLGGVSTTYLFETAIKQSQERFKVDFIYRGKYLYSFAAPFVFFSKFLRQKYRDIVS